MRGDGIIQYPGHMGVPTMPGAIGPQRHAQASPQMLPAGPRDPRLQPGVLFIEGGRTTIRHIDFSEYTQIPAVYVVSVLLGNSKDSRKRNDVNLRPELFLLKRITWASTNDDPIGSGRSANVLWSDEFTSFLGRSPIILPALFGDSQGFLDLTREVLFAGKQTLAATLTRIIDFGEPDESTLFNIVFHGTGLLPPGMNASGSL